MVPPRRPVAPIADSLTEDEKALMLVAVRLDSALRRRDKEPGTIVISWFMSCIQDEMVRNFRPFPAISPNQIPSD